jgi:hypothetical protein
MSEIPDRDRYQFFGQLLTVWDFSGTATAESAHELDRLFQEILSLL